MSPFLRFSTETGFTWRISPSWIVGCMLRPHARKRKPSPSESKDWMSAPNNSECALSSTTEIQDLRHRAFVRNEAKPITGHTVRHLMEKGKRESQWAVAVKRREATREQFGHCSSLGKREDLVSVPVFQHEDFLDLRLLRRGKTRFSVPGSPVHPNLIRLLAQNDP